MEQRLIEPVEFDDNWTEIISPKNNLFDLRLREVWQYKDLLILFVRRDFVATYKQTILGPIWFLLQPIMTTFTFMIIFGTIAGLSTDGIPMMVFYMSGVTLWNYFSECLNKTSTVFKDNANIFGKVYFPRLIMPLSIVVSNLVRLGIQMALFLGVWLFYLIQGSKLHPGPLLLIVPYLIFLMAIIGLGAGMLISSLTTKYRDLVFLLGFGVQLLMYATPVIYSMNSLPLKYAWIIKINPLSHIIESFRYAFTGSGLFSWYYIGYSTICAFALLFFGALVFNKVEKSFMDTV